MTTGKRTKTLLTFAAVAMAVVLATTASAGEIIYEETFDGNGSSGLDGVAPTIGEGTWAAKGEFVMTDGSINSRAARSKDIVNYLFESP